MIVSQSFRIIISAKFQSKPIKAVLLYVLYLISIGGCPFDGLAWRYLSHLHHKFVHLTITNLIEKYRARHMNTYCVYKYIY